MANRKPTKIAGSRLVPMKPQSQQPGAARPPTKGAPPRVFPITVDESQNGLAPVPINDRYPIVVGQSLTTAYLSNVLRLSTSGYRQQLVDVLNELLEQDPHLFSVVTKRILSSAVGRLEITACKVDPNSPDADKAEEIRAFVETELLAIPDLTQCLSALLWAIYYGLSCQEIYWTRDASGWHIDRLGFVHSRRLAYPDYQGWDLYIWDQGQVYGWQSPWGVSETNSNLYGLRVADWPGKFVVHAPQVRGDYPTREGIGRQVAMWSLFKRVGARGAIAYLERFAKPFMDISFSTSETGLPREATAEDIALASKIAAAVGPGSGSYSDHPDCIKVEPKSYDGVGASKLSWTEWIGLCNAEMSKATLGGTLGTDVGKGGGNRALGEVQEHAEVDIEQYDATCLGETIRRDIVQWLVRLNRPDCLHLVPHVKIHIDPDPDPKTIIELAERLTNIGAPVDVDDTAQKVGITNTPNEDKRPRRSFKSDFADPFQVDPSLMSDEAKQAAQDDKDAQNEIAKAKAAQPVVAGPPGIGSPKAVKSGKGAKGARPSKANRQLRDRLLLSDRPDKAVATQVLDQLLDDYPRKSLGWILDVAWEGPMMVELSDIDYSTRNTWRASHESIDPYIERISAGRMKPIIMVRRPNKPKCMIVDGHHRALAYEKLDRPAIAYVAKVDREVGPWDELHTAQKKGSSRSGGSWLDGSIPANSSRLLSGTAE